MTSVAGQLAELQLAADEVDALAAIALEWFDNQDWSDADPVLVERAGHMLGAIARSAATAATKIDGVHCLIADAQPAPAGERWDYSDGTSPGDDEDMPAEDIAIVQRIRTRCPDARFDACTDEQLIQLFKRNKRVLSRSDEDVIAAMTHPR